MVPIISFFHRCLPARPTYVIKVNWQIFVHDFKLNFPQVFEFLYMYPPVCCVAGRALRGLTPPYHLASPSMKDRCARPLGFSLCRRIFVYGFFFGLHGYLVGEPNLWYPTLFLLPNFNCAGQPVDCVVGIDELSLPTGRGTQELCVRISFVQFVSTILTMSV